MDTWLKRWPLPEVGLQYRQMDQLLHAQLISCVGVTDRFVVQLWEYVPRRNILQDIGHWHTRLELSFWG